MKLSDMKRLLDEREIQLTKSLGQNFLHDGNQLRRIVEASELRKGDKVLEIGPGLGPLTERLLEAASEVLAIEKDARLVEVLRARFSGSTANRLELVHADALDYLRKNQRDWTGWKLVANLPYSVASPILVELTQCARGPERLTATLQIEVAQRLMAKSGEADYGVLTLLVQLFYEPLDWFKIPASCFFPEPDVDSACVSLRRRPTPALEPARTPVFARLVKRAFSQRRKMMVKLLKQDWPVSKLERAFENLRLAPGVRAEQVSLEQFVQLTRELATVELSPNRSEIPMTEEIFDVVNEQDEVIGRETRREVHRLGLMHRAVHVLVFNAAGNVFLQKRSMKKDRQPGVWDSSASGHVDTGEDYDACAVRELREELGFTPGQPPRRLFKLHASEQTDQEHVWVYICVGEGPFVLHPDEIERGDWFEPTAVTKWLAERPGDFASAVLVIWKRYLETPL